MAGICGYAGERTSDVNFSIDLTWTGREFEESFEDPSLQVSQFGHTEDVNEQPIELQSGEMLWMWGDVYGRRDGNAYTSRRESGLSKLEFVARSLGRDWRSGVGGLNGSFVLVVYDQGERELHLVTDKILSRSLYYASTPRGLVFSPRLQSIYLETDLSPTLDREHLQAYFAGGLSGLYTPFQDTRLCPPGSIVTYDIRLGELSIDTYWHPEHDPVDRSAEWFTDEFVRRLEDAVEDRVGGDRDVALMLSGGGDSRLLGAILDELGVDYRAYHATSWESSYEATIARCVADQLDAKLTVVTRDADHFEDLLGEPLRLYNFQGLYEQAHFEPVMDEVETGLLFTGEFADAMFKGNQLPRRRTPTQVENIRDVELGRFTLDEFLKYKFTRSKTPYYYTGECRPLSATIHQNVYHRDDEVVNHGVAVGSAKDLLLTNGFYPSTNLSPYFRHSLLENAPLRTPYMDERLIDLYLKMPVELMFERNLVNMALSQVAPRLSVIANASTAFPPVVKNTYHNSADFGFPGARAAMNLPDPPEDWQGHDSWGYAMHNDDLIRTAILENREIIESASFLDDERLLEQASGRAPWGGDDQFHGYEYRQLLSFVCSPIAEQLV